MEGIAATITDWLRGYAAQAGAGGYVVGLSGGVDSAVLAALCVRAVGGDNVVLVKMPCQPHSDDGVMADAVAGWLGVLIQCVDLEAVYRQFLVDATNALPPLISPVVTGNIKARLRMMTLYAIANARSYLVAGTGNRTELELGYFTKYGDGGVDVLPLGNLYKTRVWELARYLGVPQAVIERPPSAGLWAGQTDEGELGATYAELDAALRLLNDGITPGLVEPAVLDRVKALREAARHKLNMPPVCPLGEEC